MGDGLSPLFSLKPCFDVFHNPPHFNLTNKMTDEHYPIMKTDRGFQRTSMKCDRCNWKWSTISDAWMVSCPGCGKKVKRFTEDNLNKMEEKNNGKNTG